MTDWDLAQLRTLAAVADIGTFDGAARALHLTPSAVSQRIKALERSAGAVLLRRERPVRPTAAGRPVVRLARQIDRLARDAERDLDGAGPQTFALAVNGDSLTTWVLPALAPLAGTTSFEIHREDQDVSAELLRDGIVMAAVTAESAPVQGCTSELLGTMRYRPTASPGFRDRWFPDGATPEALRAAPVVVFDPTDRLQDRFLERHGITDPSSVRHQVPAASDFALACRLGLGWGMLPEIQVADDLARGDLVRLDTSASIDVTLYWQQWSLRTPTLDRVADAVRAGAEAALGITLRRRTPPGATPRRPRSTRST